MVLSVEVSEDLRRKVEARAAESGHATVEQYVQALLRSDAEGVEDFGAPDSVTVKSQAQLESLLIDRMENGGPSIELTPDFWRHLKELARGPQGGGVS